ncbi:unnamed protein product, partial [Heterosigma akashiwo]
MFGLGVGFLWDLEEYRTGVLMIGLARCIAMVIVWNDLAGGDPEYCAALVALNSIFQILLYSPLAHFFFSVLLNQDDEKIDVTMAEIATSVAIYLGIPCGCGILTRLLFINVLKRDEWYQRKFIPLISPLTLVALLVTIIFLFALQGREIVRLPTDVLRIAVPLLIYFLLMFFIAFFAAKGCLQLSWRPCWPYAGGEEAAGGLWYPKAAAVAFTAASNNFELAIAVSVGAFGSAHGAALAAVVGPLVEVPVLLALVRVA